MQRPCPYCTKLVTNWRRHVTSVHINEVAHLLDLSPKKKTQAFRKVRNIGIEQYNRAQSDGNDMMRCRKGFNPVVKCQNCLELVQSKNIKRHICSKILGVQSTIPAEQDSFATALLGLKHDELGDVIRKDAILRRIGKQYFRNKNTKTKIKETHIKIRKLLRAVAKIYVESRKKEESKIVGVGDLFLMSNLEYVTDIITEISETSANLLHYFGSITIAAEIYALQVTLDGNDELSNSVDKFLSKSKVLWRRPEKNRQ